MQERIQKAHTERDESGTINLGQTLNPNAVAYKRLGKHLQTVPRVSTFNVGLPGVPATRSVPVEHSTAFLLDGRIRRQSGRCATGLVSLETRMSYPRN